MRYSIRLHHFTQWYFFLHDPPTYNQYLEQINQFDRAEQRVGPDEEPLSRAYLDFWYYGTAAFFNGLKQTDFIDVVESLDSICAFCPDIVPDKCSRPDDEDALVEKCGIKAGQSYRVADVLDKFACFKEYYDSREFSMTF